MDGKAKKPPSPPAWENMVKGAVAGVTSRTASAPFDLLKIRFQLQQRSAAPRKTGTMASSRIWTATRDVIKNEGPWAFWKGNVAGIYLYAIYSSVQFGVYERMHGTSGTSAGVSGAVASMMGTLISYPFDVIRTRHSLQRPTATGALYYHSVPQTIQTILQSEGVSGLYRGIIPSMAQIVPYMSIVFTVYDRVRQSLRRQRPNDPSTVDAIAGAVSGVVGKSIMMPVDTVRKRLQIQGSPYQVYVLRGLPIYSGLLDCVRTIMRVEGPHGFFNGLSLALLKSVPATTTTFLVYGFLSRARNA